MKIEVGKVYILGGNGPMECKVLPKQVGQTYQFMTPSGYGYYAHHDQVIGEASLEYLETFLGQLMSHIPPSLDTRRRLGEWIDAARTGIEENALTIDPIMAKAVMIRLIESYAKGEAFGGNIDWDDLNQAFELAKRAAPGLYEKKLAYFKQDED